MASYPPKDNTTPWYIYVFVVGIIFLFIAVFMAMALHTADQQKVFDNAESKLKSDGFQLVAGTLNSPAIVQWTQNFTEFESIAKASGVTTIYVTSPRTLAIVANLTYGCEWVVG